MDKRLSQPLSSPAPSEDPFHVTAEHEVPREHSKENTEVVRRRDIASLLGGALGAFALSACANEAKGQSSVGSREAIGQLTEALSGSDLKWVTSVLGNPLRTGDLATMYGPSGTNGVGASVVIAQGCITANDGGGGIFYWVSGTATDDGGAIIVPSHQPSTAGYWQRVVAGRVSVRWFGAYGDGTHDDTAAIQNAINFVSANLPSPYVAGNDVLVPPGKYLVTAPSGAAALWLLNNVNLVGEGGPPYGPQILIAGPGSGVAVETRGTGVARGAQIRNLSFYPSSPTPQDAIVLHTNNAAVYDCFITGMGRHGILIESGYATSGGLLGVTKSLDGAYFNSNSWRLHNVFIGQCGNTSSHGDETQGAGVYAHGSDSNNGYASACFGQSNNVSFFDGTLGGATWVGCYSEGAQIGFKSAPSGTSTYLGCGAEDLASFPTGRGLVVGGSLVGNGPEQKIGTDGATYGLYVPGSYGSALDFYRMYRPWSGPSAFSSGTLVSPQPANGYYYKCTTAGTSGATQPAFPTTIGATVNDGSVVWTCAGTASASSSLWSLAWQPFQPYANMPYMQNSWRWEHYTNFTGPDIDPYNGPFGWTDIDNIRGAGLPFIGNPLINTTRRWSWRQALDTQSRAIQLAPGSNVVYLWGYQQSPGTSGNWTDSGGVTFAGDPSSTWSKAQTRVSVDIEFASQASLSSADIHVVGYTFVSESGGARNVSAKIVNGGSNAVAVAALVWHFETFVTNYDGSPS
jgi:Pectate lyase superfamily protein